MNKDYTHVAILLDRSGSMHKIRDDMIGGFNNLLAEQQKVPGKCTLSLVQFDDENPQDVLRDFAPISEVRPLGDDFQPRGNTPLYDALGRFIVATGVKLRELPEALRPGNVVFVIITDGQENASREYTSARVAKMIAEQSEVYKWHFTYLGANHDAIVAARAIGIRAAGAMNYASTPKGVRESYSAASANLCSLRSGSSNSMDWSEQQREATSK